MLRSRAGLTVGGEEHLVAEDGEVVRVEITTDEFRGPGGTPIRNPDALLAGVVKSLEHRQRAAHRLSLPDNPVRPHMAPPARSGGSSLAPHEVRSFSRQHSCKPARPLASFVVDASLV